jgi:flagellar biogenesis protein FliO
MDKTLKVMDNSQSRLRKELGRLKVFTDKYSNTCLMQILLMLVVVMVFVIMYIFIRLVPKKTASVAVLSNLSPATLTSNGPVSTAISVINHNEL